MPNNRFALFAAALVASAARLAAQEVPSCGGPGAAFGVTSYQCASCGVKQGQGVRTQFTFQAEPIVLEVAKTSVLQAGDVIVAVNGEPILTQVGADQFTYPRAGTSTVTVRRGTSRVDLTATAVACQALPKTASQPATVPLLVVDGVVVPNTSHLSPRELVDSVVAAGTRQTPPREIESVEVLRGFAAEGLYGSRAGQDIIVVRTKRGVSIRQKSGLPISADTGPLTIVDGVRVTNAPIVDSAVAGNGRRYGFAIGCLPSCTKARASDGTDYYTFDGYPPVVALVPGGPAERAGMRVGDLVTQIDGKSILTEEGVLRFFRATRKDSMQVTVMRDRRQAEYLLRTR